MALSWNKPDEKPVGMIADRDLWLDKSGENLAREGSAEAASLLMGKGREIDPADIARLNLVGVGGRVVQREDALPAEEPEAEETEKESPGESEG